MSATRGEGARIHFAVQCEHGFVKVVAVVWNQPFINELAPSPVAP
jgi:hypothetical protein